MASFCAFCDNQSSKEVMKDNAALTSKSQLSFFATVDCDCDLYLHTGVLVRLNQRGIAELVIDRCS